MMKRCSFSYKMRQSLSDITNSQSHSQEEIDSYHSEHVQRLMKENVALVKLVEEREYELKSLREGINKLKVQNWSLAQTNTQFLNEVHLARNKVKALQHEVTCKTALLKAKCWEQEKDENTQPRNVLTTENVLKSTDEDSEKPSLPNRRRFIKHNFSCTASHNTEAQKEKSENKRYRRQLRRKSRRVRRSATENLFEIKDLDLAMPNDDMYRQQDNSKTASHTQKKADFRRGL